MAKSLRSKWRRKCRAVKRVRYGEKELVRLKKTLGIDDKNATDAAMEDIAQVATVTDAKSIKSRREGEEEPTEEVEEVMDTAGKRVFNTKTMKDQNGTYPVWMNQRKIRKQKNAIEKKKKKTRKSKGKVLVK